MDRRVFLNSVGLLSLGLSGPLTVRDTRKQPNVLFIFSDNHSLQTLGAYRSRIHEFIKRHNITPNIDKIAAQRVLFENSFVGNSICGPSRASILTGKHSHANGFTGNGDWFDPEQWTVAKELQKSNCQTAAIGK